MHSTTTIYLGIADLEASATSPVFTDDDGNPWVTVTLGGFETHGSVQVHIDPRDGTNPLVLAQHLERLATDIRNDFSRWVSSPASDQWSMVRKAIATAEAITASNAPKANA